MLALRNNRVTGTRVEVLFVMADAVFLAVC